MNIDYKAIVQYQAIEARQQVIALSQRIKSLSQDNQRLAHAPSIINAINYILAQLDVIRPHHAFYRSASLFEIGYSYLNKYEAKFSRALSNQQVLSILLQDIALDVLNIGCEEQALRRTQLISQFIHYVKAQLAALAEIETIQARHQTTGLMNFFNRFYVIEMCHTPNHASQFINNGIAPAM